MSSFRTPLWMGHGAVVLGLLVPALTLADGLSSAQRAVRTPSLWPGGSFLRVPSAYRISEGRLYGTWLGGPVSGPTLGLGFAPEAEVGMNAVSGGLSIVAKAGFEAGGLSFAVGGEQGAQAFFVLSREIGRGVWSLGYRNDVFGGVAFPVHKDVALIADYADRRWATGAKVFLGDRLHGMVAVEEGRVLFAGGYSIALTHSEPELDLPRRRLSRAPMSIRDDIALAFILEALRDYGLRDLSLRESGEELIVAYEASSRDELPVLRHVLEQACELAPLRFTKVRAVLKRERIGIVQVSSLAEDYLAFANGRTSVKEFAEHLRVEPFDGRWGSPMVLPSDAPPPRLIPEAQARLVLDGLSGDPRSGSATAIVQAYVGLGGGFGATGRVRREIATENDYPDPYHAQATADFAFASRGLAARISGGSFGHYGYGYAASLAAPIGDSLDVFAETVSARRSGETTTATTVGVGFEVPGRDVRVTGAYRRFADGLTGFELGATRRFADADVRVTVGRAGDTDHVTLHVSLGQGVGVESRFVHRDNGPGGPTVDFRSARTAREHLWGDGRLSPGYFRGRIAQLRDPRWNQAGDNYVFPAEDPEEAPNLDARLRPGGT